MASSVRSPNGRVHRGAGLIVLIVFASLPGGAAQALSFGLGGGVGALIADDPRYPPKLQPGVRFAAAVEIDRHAWMRFGLAGGWHVVGASNTDGGFSYRGLTGLDVRAYSSAEATLGTRIGAGVSAGVLARMDRYAYTRLYFFYPGVFSSFYVEMEVPGSAGLRLYRNFELYLRRDLEICLALGIGISVFLPPASAGEEER